MKQICFGGTGAIGRKEGDKRTKNMWCLVSLLLYDIAKYGIATVWEAPMDGLGRTAVGQQSGGSAILWEGSDIWTEIADEIDNFWGVSKRHEN